MNIGISSFVRRQTPQSQYSHFEGSDDELLQIVQKDFTKANQGYREGVLVVPVAVDKFFTGICLLKEGDKLAGEFKPRHPGEEPRKSTYKVGGQKMPAKKVDIILYHKDVLAEDNGRSCDTDWEIISINASPIEGEIPIQATALIYNHFHLDGGTKTNMSDEDFVKQLKISVEFWKDKTFAEPKNEQ